MNKLSIYSFLNLTIFFCKIFITNNNFIVLGDSAVKKVNVVLGDSADKKVNGKTRSAIKDKYFFIRAPLRDI